MAAHRSLAATPRTSALPELAAAVLARLPQIADELINLVELHETSYLERVPASEVRSAFFDNLSSALSIASGTLRPRVDPLEAPTVSGRRRAEQGVPLESVLHAYRLGVQIVWVNLFTEAGSRSPDLLRQLIDEAATVWELADQQSFALVDAYRAREAEIRRRDALRGEAIVEALLDGRGVDPAVAAEAQAMLGLPARGRYVVVATTGEPGSSAACRFPRDALAASAIRSAWCVRAGREIGVVELGRTPVARLAALLGSEVRQRAAVSCEVESLGEIVRAHQFAEFALRTLPDPEAGVAVFDDRLLEALVVSSPDIAWRLARRALGHVLDLPEAERDVLLDTLDAWFRSDRSATQAARELHCHRNTVLNRLRRIQELAGSTLEDPRHRLSCALALLVLRTLGHQGGGAPPSSRRLP